MRSIDKSFHSDTSCFAKSLINVMLIAISYGTRTLHMIKLKKTFQSQFAGIPRLGHQVFVKKQNMMITQPSRSCSFCHFHLNTGMWT